eukprot:Gb_00332 [translate_table: standard]
MGIRRLNSGNSLPRVELITILNLSNPTSRRLWNSTLKAPRLFTIVDLYFTPFRPSNLLNSMASRYATLLRSVRPAFNSGGNSFRAAGGRAAPSTPRRSFSAFRNPIGYDSARFRRHCAKSLIPLHDAVAAAKLISHLSVSSRSRSALSLGLQGYVNAPFHGSS